MNIPEIIEGIPTDKKSSDLRRDFIRQTYMNLLQHLQQTRRKKAIYNDFLGALKYI